MANYLPVLLVSVANTHTIPDDSSLSTQPRAQVDYLSHEWQEEDVWRSWRNMTRQKNEIANGVRLENASWRTWWKQRNKLKTITPETLNWLKDSDVTWLYGPLHTAVDWTPPARPQLERNNSSQIPVNPPRHKPILKHRSISELLTSDLPASPLFSPPESGDEARPQLSGALLVPSDNANLDAQKPLITTPHILKRPGLVHTKSDTHITRWGPSRVFRKDSPPRIDPPGTSSGVATNQHHKPRTHDRFSQSQIRASSSQDSNSSTGTSTTSVRDIGSRRSSSHNTHKKKHISFNTFVEQYIAIEKPNKVDEALRVSDSRRWDYDDGYEEDEEDIADEEDEAWDGRTRHHQLSGSAIAGSDSDSGEDESRELEEDDDDDDVLEMRPSAYSHLKNPPKKQQGIRSSSTSASMSTSSSTSTSTSSRSISPSSGHWRKASDSPTSSAHSSSSIPTGTSSRRSSTTSTCRPRFNWQAPRTRPRTRSGSDHRPRFPLQQLSLPVHVTIAPIAPTILKTTDAGFGGWAEGFGDEGGSDDGLWSGKWGGDGGREKEKKAIQEDGESTPVELVYVPPPFIGRYNVGLGVGTEEEDIDDMTGERDTPNPVSRSSALRTTGHPSSILVKDSEVGRSDSSAASTITPSSPIPTVIIESLPQPTSQDKLQQTMPRQLQADESAHAGDGKLQGNISRRYAGPEEAYDDGERHSRSRSRSRSRTPSPAVLPTPSIDHALVPQDTHDATCPPTRGRSLSVSPPHAPSSSSLLSPPQRGRSSSSYQDLSTRCQQAPIRPSRGRSSTRTPPSSSYSDREQRHGSGGSPIGGLSPEGSFVGVASIVGGAYASGRTDRERQKERERRDDRESFRERDGGRERGRDRTGKRLSQSLSPEFESGNMKREGSSSNEGRTGRTAPPSTIGRTPSSRSPVEEACAHSIGDERQIHYDAQIDAALSSASVVAKTPTRATEVLMDNVNHSCIPPIQQADNNHYITSGHASEDVQRVIQPTPSNTPVITMRTPPAGLVGSNVDTSTNHSRAHYEYQASPQIHLQSNTSSLSSSASPSYHHQVLTQSSMTLHSSTNNTSTMPGTQSPANAKSPLFVPLPHPVEPSTSLSISLPGNNALLSPPRSPGSPGSPTGKEASIVEKAVGIVSSAGAYLGFWHHMS
ncbi:hypothetical protein AMATHDRAFT_4152 [Amanita thiersii Skay4041]|uniref:Nitrogen regulatory protein areA GATA-like domain-containing protein n=1 Tax=Amanita thiersii Skay4041 TaxID=703135 RepID=A0A2A9NRE2_9AGAR|nr:hypothetical protein AMATHDRAFT_4152 [Amanita thiersii Skay4041]